MRMNHDRPASLDARSPGRGSRPVPPIGVGLHYLFSSLRTLASEFRFGVRS